MRGAFLTAHGYKHVSRKRVGNTHPLRFSSRQQPTIRAYTTISVDFLGRLPLAGQPVHELLQLAYRKF